MGKKSRCKRCCRWCLLFIVLATIAFGVFITLKLKNQKSDSDGSPILVSVAKKYEDALHIAMQFFDIQKSGKLVDKKISWRGDSVLKDESQAKLNLSKGMHDAGDHMKFGFSLAFTATVLSWSILEYGDQMKAVNQLESAQDSLKWITDYLTNAHPSANDLYIQVGSPKADHSCRDRPDDMTGPRPLSQVNTSTPGTEVAVETALDMASASLVFKSIDSAYSSLLMKHATQLFTFADKHRKFYSIRIPEVKTYYSSMGYGDELLWAGSWPYHATGEQSFFGACDWGKW